MRYYIVRRNKRIRRLLFILLLAVCVLAGPRIYKNVFIHERELEVEDRIGSLDDFFSKISGAAVDKDVSLDVSFLENDYLFSEVAMEGMELGGMMVSGDVVIKGRFLKDNQGVVNGFSGKMVSENITLNSDPFMKISMSFDITKDRLQIKSLRFNKSYEFKGTINLARPFETDLRFDIKRADIRDIAVIAKVKNADIVFGMMSGVFYIKGPLANLVSNGILQSRHGKLGRLEYSSATVRIEGFGPIIKIVDSALKHGDSGTVTVDGYIDLRNMARGNLFGGLSVKSDMKTIVWKDWDITNSGTDELKMTKQISDKMRIGFKTVAREPSTTFRDRENPEELELEYEIGEDNLNLKLRDNEGFFGIEHNVKF